jgi:hypothetical protein
LRIVRERRQLIAALTVRSAQDPTLTALGEQLHEHISAHMRALIAARGDRFAHEDAETGIHVAVGMVLSFVESRAIHRTERLPDEQLAAEIARLIVRYLGVESPQTTLGTNGRKRAQARHTPRTATE